MWLKTGNDEDGISKTSLTHQPSSQDHIYYISFTLFKNTPLKNYSSTTVTTWCGCKTLLVKYKSLLFAASLRTIHRLAALHTQLFIMNTKTRPSKITRLWHFLLLLVRKINPWRPNTASSFFFFFLLLHWLGISFFCLRSFPPPTHWPLRCRLMAIVLAYFLLLFFPSCSTCYVCCALMQTRKANLPSKGFLKTENIYSERWNTYRN